MANSSAVDKLHEEKYAQAVNNKSIQILYIDNNVGETNAAYNEHVLSKAEDYDVSLCCYFPSPIDVPPSVQFYEGDGSIKSFYRKLKLSLKAKDYNIIHIHAPHVGVLTVLYLLFLDPRLLKRTVYTVHSSYQNYSLIHLLLIVLPFALFNSIVHCSWSSYHSFPWLYRTLAGKRRTAIPNGVDVTRVMSVLHKAVNDEPAMDDKGALKISSIGRLRQSKNFDTLIEAIRLLDIPNLAVDIFGQGGLHDSLVEKIKQENLEDIVTLRGVVPRDQIYREMALTDVYVSTSVIEGLPIAVMEAMSCGTPVVLSDIPPHRELADVCDFITLVPVNDVKGYAAELHRILAMSSEDRAELGEKSRRLVNQHFSLDAMHEGYFRLYTRQ